MRATISLSRGDAQRLMRMATDYVLTNSEPLPKELATFCETEDTIDILEKHIVYTDTFTRGWIAGRIDVWLNDPKRPHPEFEHQWKNIRKLACDLSLKN